MMGSGQHLAKAHLEEAESETRENGWVEADFGPPRRAVAWILRLSSVEVGRGERVAVEGPFE